MVVSIIQDDWIWLLDDIAVRVKMHYKTSCIEHIEVVFHHASIAEYVAIV